MKKLNKIAVVIMVTVVLAVFQSHKIQAQVFNAGEASISLASAYTVDKAKLNDAIDRSVRGGTHGYSIGGEYFFHQNFGLGLTTLVPDAKDVSGGLFDSAEFSLIGRVPIGRIAPYALAGVGRNFEHGHYTSHAGAGIEARLSKHAAVFVESRYAWARTASDTFQLKGGLRFAF